VNLGIELRLSQRENIVKHQFIIVRCSAKICCTNDFDPANATSTVVQDEFELWAAVSMLHIVKPIQTAKDYLIFDFH
jgi:hypothetical protein